MTDDLPLFASAPRGFGDLLVRELESFGGREVREQGAGVRCVADLATAYRACLESRIANRIFVELARFQADTADSFYRHAREIPWVDHVSEHGTLACEFTGRHPAINHSHFGALRLKDAICDVLRDEKGSRPDIQAERPDVLVHAHAQGTRVMILLDLSGESLHRRGYRVRGGEAPLKENVAAGILLRAGWPRLAAEQRALLDPLCGSGTFVIEAALIALDRAPGLERDYFGFLGWLKHDPQVWSSIRTAAQSRAEVALVREMESIAASGAPRICGSDRDARALTFARENARRARVDSVVRFEQQDAANVAPLPQSRGGLVCTNPPYGVRLEDQESARQIFRELGTTLRDKFAGWDATVLAGNPQLGLELGIRAFRTHVVWNGAIECKLLRLHVEPGEFMEAGRPPRSEARAQELRESPGAQMFANRIAKNLRLYKRWLARDKVTCYRLYDADMPEYAFAIDVYREVDSERLQAVVQEYAAPAEIEIESVQRRRNEALSVLPEALGVGRDSLHIRLRRRSVQREQYTRQDDRGDLRVVSESGLKFYVNLEDYLDTGLFLDHRLTRQYLRAAAAGKRFLNLFCYTGTASVYAAAGGAPSSISVDLSNRYLDWAQRNLGMNGFHASRSEEAPHQLVQDDCREWLNTAAKRELRFDLIFLDPPTFSNSKRMEGVLDIQRDHGALIDSCYALLAPGGQLLFSTNAQRFKLDAVVAEKYRPKDLSRALLPADFARHPRIHQCFRIQANCDSLSRH